MNNNLNDQFLSRKKNRYFLKHIATIFVRLEINFNKVPKNSTSFPFATDCLTEDSRKLLFKTVANTLEFKIVDRLEAKLARSIASDHALTMLEEIILISLQKFTFLHFCEDGASSEVPEFGFHLSLCDLVVWNHLLNYFYTGDSRALQKQQSITLSLSLLEEHILALLDHFVIKLANIVTDSILSSSGSASEISLLTAICSSGYSSQRHLINLKNNLFLFKGLDFYVYNPKLIYENKYLLFNLESGFICCKNIYSDRQKELALLSRPQLIILFLLEIQDLILPKLKNLVYLSGKSLIYIFSYALGATIKVLRSRPS
nr:Ycf55 [Porphyrostromium japonicum]